MPKTVLIVEDEDSVRELEKLVLTQLGYDVMEARDGLEGLAKAEFRRPDLILLDLKMPDLSGDRVLEEIQRHPVTAGIPVIVITGSTEAREMLDHLGPDDVVMKPFETDTLLARIRDHIGDAE
jgi:DNA-binding response OmpR family regulator